MFVNLLYENAFSTQIKTTKNQSQIISMKGAESYEVRNVKFATVYKIHH